MVSMETVRASIEAHWTSRFVGVPTAYTGQEFDVDRLPAWAELWVTSGDSVRRRSAEPDAMSVTVAAHIFVRDRSDARRAERLVDSAKAALFPAEIVSEDMRVSLREVSVRDLSRDDSEKDGRPLRHLVLIVRGRVVELCPS